MGNLQKESSFIIVLGHCEPSRSDSHGDNANRVFGYSSISLDGVIARKFFTSRSLNMTFYYNFLVIVKLFIKNLLFPHRFEIRSS